MNVFVSIGTHAQPFNRLLEAVDRWAAGKKSVTVFAQIGYSTYTPQHMEFKKFLSDQEYEKQMGLADVVISHAGAGTILHALTKQKPLIVVPRLKQFNEHTDDHQIDLAQALEKRGHCVFVKETQELEGAIEQIKNKKNKPMPERAQLIQKLQEIIRNEE